MVVLGKQLQQISPKTQVTKVSFFVGWGFFNSLAGNSQIHPFDLPWQLQCYFPKHQLRKNVFIVLFPLKHILNSHLSLESKVVPALQPEDVSLQRGVVRLPQP